MDGSITANNNSVWKKITPTNTNNSFGGGGCPTYYSYFYLELSQNNSSGNSTCLHEPTNCSNSIYVMGRLNNQDNFTIGNTNISKKEVYYLLRDSYVRSNNSTGIRTYVYGYINFRPVFQYKDNNKSRTIFN